MVVKVPEKTDAVNKGRGREFTAHQTVAVEIRKKRTNARQRAAHAACGFSVAVPRTDVSANMIGADGAPVGHRQCTDECIEIASVGGERVRRIVLFVVQVIDEQRHLGGQWAAFSDRHCARAGARERAPTHRRCSE